MLVVGCWVTVGQPSAPLGLRVDRGHVAQAALKAAHREEDALLRAGGELATRASLQLLAQAEACDRAGDRAAWSGGGFWAAADGPLPAADRASPAAPVLLLDMWKPFCG